MDYKVSGGRRCNASANRPREWATRPINDGVPL
jgi:hypothetical protein